MELYENEQIKPIPGYENYLITSFGRVWSTISSKWLKGDTQGGSTKKYLRVSLYKDKKAYHFLVHRLVAENFIPNTNNLPVVNHKDENSLNNKVDNLEWCTQKYNINYGTHNERVSKTMKEKFKKNS